MSMKNMEQERIDRAIKKLMKTKLKPCVLCGGRFSEWGNNPAPLKLRGQCCDHCNRTLVIPARLQAVFPRIKDKKLPAQNTL